MVLIGIAVCSKLLLLAESKTLKAIRYEVRESKVGGSSLACAYTSVAEAGSYWSRSNRIRIRHDGNWGHDRNSDRYYIYRLNDNIKSSGNIANDNPHNYRLKLNRTA